VTCRIVTRGRRTGREHVVTVWCCPLGSRLYAPSRHGVASDWLQNALAAAAVIVRQRRQEWTGRARLVTEPAEVTQVLDAFARKYHRYARIIDRWRNRAPVFAAILLLGPEDQAGRTDV
jgi:deazaflavin-dependent oxidoreductase (nitroreductase family)